MSTTKALTPAQQQIKEDIIGKLSRHYGRTIEDATKSHIYKATALTVRDTIMKRWTEYRRSQRTAQRKELFYLSFEFLMGRSLGNNLLNVGLTEDYEAVLQSMGCSLDEIASQESDAGLGNGGLGRLAACFLDSLAALNLPAFGCSIRYEYGLFKQKIIDGQQVETPDNWLEDGTVWEIPRPEEQQVVHFGGHIKTDYVNGKMKVIYEDTTDVLGIPYDVPIAGYNANLVNTLRLWSARAKNDLNMTYFSGGDYVKAVEEKALAEALSKVLYPEDNHQEGKQLRLRQQYFFVSCTLQWIISRFKRHHKGEGLEKLADYITIHINDTHPALAIPELMRILMDDEGMGWDEAWAITTRVFAYTNHTVLAEALEKWPVEMFQRLLPRIWMIVEEMNRRLQNHLLSIYGEDWGKINYMAIVAQGYVSMANMCLASCYKVNGVSELHTDILKKDVFRDYYNLFPDKFVAITNGITFRRWLRLANPELSALISSKIGDGWITDASELEGIAKYADDPEFQESFRAVKLEKKKELAAYIKAHNGIDVDPESIFDVQVKRLHEYKRQLMNILHVLYLYDKLKRDKSFDMVPHTFIFGAKASPGYKRAKLIIRLINDVAALVDNDPEIGGRLKVVFIENYGVTLAQKIIPAAEISEQISTAGKEASGTGNMKFMANGALTIGTLDGANVEMLRCVGEDNIFIFGMTSAEVSNALRFGGKSSQDIYASSPDVRRVIDMLIDGTVNPSDHHLYYDLYQSLVFGERGMVDNYMVVRDFLSYCEIHRKAELQYRDKTLWTRKAILNVAHSGFFSSDRTIKEYNDKIWHLSAVEK